MLTVLVYANAARSAVQDMGVNHRRLDVAVAKDLMYGPDVMTILEQVGGEGMPEGMAGNVLGRPGLQYRVPQGSPDE